MNQCLMKLGSVADMVTYHKHYNFQYDNIGGELQCQNFKLIKQKTKQTICFSKQKLIKSNSYPLMSLTYPMYTFLIPNLVTTLKKYNPTTMFDI